MTLTPELLIIIAGQIIGTGITIGMYRQTQRHHAERLVELREHKLDKEVHDAEMERIDSDIGMLKVASVAIDSRVRAIETGRNR